MTTLQGRVVVTGGGNGIGAGTGEAFAEAGATVMMADVQAEHVHKVPDRLAGRGFRQQLDGGYHRRS